MIFSGSHSPRPGVWHRPVPDILLPDASQGCPCSQDVWTSDSAPERRAPSRARSSRHALLGLLSSHFCGPLPLTARKYSQVRLFPDRFSRRADVVKPPNSSPQAQTSPLQKFMGTPDHLYLRQRPPVHLQTLYRYLECFWHQPGDHQLIPPAK